MCADKNPTLGGVEPRDLACALRNAFAASNPDALIDGAPDNPTDTLIDGGFDLVDVAKRTLAALRAPPQ